MKTPDFGDFRGANVMFEFIENRIPATRFQHLTTVATFTQKLKSLQTESYEMNTPKKASFISLPNLNCFPLVSWVGWYSVIE